MKLDFQHLIPDQFAADSRVWIYQCNRLLSIQEALHVEDILNNFISSWNSHGAKVQGYGNLLFGQFLVLIADERATGVSGCSTDSSVRMVKQIEETLKVNMFDRQLLAFIVKEKVQLIPLQQLTYAIENGFITPDTLYFNNTVGTKEQLLKDWIIPVENSWLAKKFKSTSATSQ